MYIYYIYSPFKNIYSPKDKYTSDPEDHKFERDGATVVVDDSSLEFVRGATIDYVQEMIKSSFVVSNNPNSESACGVCVC